MASKHIYALKLVTIPNKGLDLANEIVIFRNSHPVPVPVVIINIIYKIIYFFIRKVATHLKRILEVQNSYNNYSKFFSVFNYDLLKAI